MDNDQMYRDAVADTWLLAEPESSHEPGTIRRLFDLIDEDAETP